MTLSPKSSLILSSLVALAVAACASDDSGSQSGNQEEVMAVGSGGRQRMRFQQSKSSRTTSGSKPDIR